MNMIDQEMGEHSHLASDPADKDVLTKRMEGLKMQHAGAMDPEVNPLDGALLPLSPALAYPEKDASSSKAGPTLRAPYV